MCDDKEKLDKINLINTALLSKVRVKFTGRITIHFKDGEAKEIEEFRRRQIIAK